MPPPACWPLEPSRAARVSAEGLELQDGRLIRSHCVIWTAGNRVNSVVTALPVAKAKDGRLLEVEITSHTLRFGGRDAELVLAHDVTERLDAQRKIARLNRVYALLSGINSAIVRIRDRDSLFKEACRLATMEGGFITASVDIVEADGLPTRPKLDFEIPSGAKAKAKAKLMKERGEVG